MKSVLLSATSAIALAAVIASPAKAFDYVDWSWNSELNTAVTADIDLGAYLYNQGITQVERVQIMVGDVHAKVDLSNTSVGESLVDQPINIVQVNAAFTQQEAGYVDPVSEITQSNSATSNVGSNVDQLNLGVALQEGIVNVATIDQTNSADIAGGDVQQVNLAAALQYGGLNKAYITQTNTVVVDLDSLAGNAALLDAREHLGVIEGAATAISNVASIESEHATSFHDGQIAFGDFGYIGETAGPGFYLYGNECGECGSSSFTGNQMHDLVGLATLGAALGVIEKGEVKAKAKANDVSNAAIDISALAAANVHTANVTTDYEAIATGSPENWVSDNVVMGDLSQFAYMDVSAKAEAKNLTITGFSNLGGIGAPISKATATALGNVSSVVNKSPGAQ